MKIEIIERTIEEIVDHDTGKVYENQEEAMIAFGEYLQSQGILLFDIEAEVINDLSTIAEFTYDGEIEIDETALSMVYCSTQKAKELLAEYIGSYYNLAATLMDSSYSGIFACDPENAESWYSLEEIQGRINSCNMAVEIAKRNRKVREIKPKSIE